MARNRLLAVSDLLHAFLCLWYHVQHFSFLAKHWQFSILNIGRLFWTQMRQRTDFSLSQSCFNLVGPQANDSGMAGIVLKQQLTF